MTANMACRMAKCAYIKVKQLLTYDDISAGIDAPVGDRRGLTGCVPLYKVLRAASEEGKSLNGLLEIGDKTMMDALIPTVMAIEECPSDEINDLLFAAAVAAQKGVETTVDMVAEFGRARNYGERSKGFMDSVTASWSAMFAAFAE